MMNLTRFNLKKNKLGKNNRLLLLSLLLGLGLLALLIFFSNLKNSYYQCDEFSYLAKSIYFDYFIKADFQNPAWQANDAVDQTKLMEYVYWLPSSLLYKKNFKDLAVSLSTPDKNYFDYGYWGSVYGQPFSQLELPRQLRKTTLFARKIAATFTVGYIIASLITVWLIFKNYLLVLLGFIFLVSQPILAIHGRQVLADSALNLFLIVSFLLTGFFYRSFWQEKKQAANRWAILAGISAGITSSIKLNGFLSSIFFLVLAAWIIILKNIDQKKHLKQTLSFILKNCLVFIFLSLAVFFILHPTLWTQPLAGLTRFFKWRLQITNFYQQSSPHEKIASLGKALQLIFLRAPGYLAGVGSIGFSFEKEFGHQSRLVYFIPNFVLFYFGLVSIITKVFFNSKKFLKSFQFLSFLWSVFIIAGVAFYLKLDWSRYYWPTLLPFLIIDGFGLKFIFDSVKFSLIKQKKRNKK